MRTATTMILLLGLTGAVQAQPTTSQPTTSQPTTGLAGCWLSQQAQGRHLYLSPKKGSYVFGDRGRWVVQGRQVWLEGPRRVGTKWRFEVDRNTLTLSQPEDFSHLGQGRYLYFRMTDPKLTYRFKRSATKRCPARATAKSAAQRRREAIRHWIKEFRHPKSPTRDAKRIWGRMEPAWKLIELKAVTVGMSKKEVLRLLGPPDDGNRKSDHWNYETSPVAGLSVTFKDGKVVDFGMACDRPPPN